MWTVNTESTSSDAPSLLNGCSQQQSAVRESFVLTSDSTMRWQHLSSFIQTQSLKRKFLSFSKTYIEIDSKESSEGYDYTIWEENFSYTWVHSYTITRKCSASTCSWNYYMSYSFEYYSNNTEWQKTLKFWCLTVLLPCWRYSFVKSWGLWCNINRMTNLDWNNKCQMTFDTCQNVIVSVSHDNLHVVTHATWLCEAFTRFVIISYSHSINRSDNAN